MRRKVSKPQMEKRRRERINHSLETLRLLVLESTNSEKLKNPKVEKAEILESVVEFLKTERDTKKGHQAVKTILSSKERPSCSRQQSYQDGMRSCLLRVSQFVASKSQEDTGGGAVQAPFVLPEPQTQSSAPGLIHIHSAGASAALSPQHHSLPFSHSSGLRCDTGRLLPSTASTHMTDPVWRPWP
ncbi:hairy-related 5 [Acanthochromis polyacanthus]|uniref:hairy-related 5 n=1 Tax=Acanthochromis polyacanthus TaxID=80966 RepID=UPI002233F57F|nr:hairy-related 5 [Acanthochromis polyacanthus]